MKPTLKTSPTGRKLIKSFEGLRRKAAPLPGGGWVIGYGHTKSAREGAEIGADDAEKLLIYDLLPVEAAINEYVRISLTQNQFDALASLTLNIGRDNFLNSTVLKRLNEDKPLEAALAFDQWRVAMVDGKSQVVETLLRRRAAERALFLTPAQAPMAAPAPVPASVADAAPRRQPEPPAQPAPAASRTPLMNFRADLGGLSLSRFELVAGDSGPAPEAASTEIAHTPAVAPEPAREPEPQPESELQPLPAPVIILAEDNDDETAFAPDEPEADFAPAEQALDAVADPVQEPFEEPAPVEAEAAAGELARIETAMAEDEAVEEVFFAADETFEDRHPNEIERPFAPEPDLSDAPQRPSWAEMARERAKMGRERAPVLPPEARREDLLVRNTEAEWSVEEEQDYAPARERGAVWHALFLVIGATLAGFGSWDTWQRATGRVEEAFVYGPAVAAFGVLFMAIAGWFLIKRVLAFR